MRSPTGTPSARRSRSTPARAPARPQEKTPWKAVGLLPAPIALDGSLRGSGDVQQHPEQLEQDSTWGGPVLGNSDDYAILYSCLFPFASM